MTKARPVDVVTKVLSPTLTGKPARVETCKQAKYHEQEVAAERNLRHLTKADLQHVHLQQSPRQGLAGEYLEG